MEKSDDFFNSIGVIGMKSNRNRVKREKVGGVRGSEDRWQIQENFFIKEGRNNVVLSGVKEHLRFCFLLWVSFVLLILRWKIPEHVFIHG